MGAIVITTLVKVAIFNKHSKMHNNILSDVEADESHYKMGSLIGPLILGPHFIVSKCLMRRLIFSESSPWK